MNYFISILLKAHRPKLRMSDLECMGSLKFYNMPSTWINTRKSFKNKNKSENDYLRNTKI